MSSYGAEPLQGRGTRVFEAVELDGNGEPNGSLVVLKDSWVDSDRMREGDILASLHAAADEEDKQLVEAHFLTTICHGDVRTDLDIVDDTATALMRGSQLAQGLRYDMRYAPKTHYRIVFKEVCITIDSMRSLPGVMGVLAETVIGAFQYCTDNL
jgi:hypothetical protein